MSPTLILYLYNTLLLLVIFLSTTLHAIPCKMEEREYLRQALIDHIVQHYAGGLGSLEWNTLLSIKRKRFTTFSAAKYMQGSQDLTTFAQSSGQLSFHNDAWFRAIATQGAIGKRFARAINRWGNWHEYDAVSRCIRGGCAEFEAVRLLKVKGEGMGIATDDTHIAVLDQAIRLQFVQPGKSIPQSMRQAPRFEEITDKFNPQLIGGYRLFIADLAPCGVCDTTFGIGSSQSLAQPMLMEPY